MAEKVHDALARLLAEAGVEVLFGVTGDANLFMVDAFVRARGGRYVAAAYEGGSVLMASGYASVSGRVGVATVTHGPAVTNCVTALADAVKSRLPVVLICGDTRSEDRTNLQNVPQREVILASGAGWEEVHSPGTVAADLARALRRAQAELRPVALNVAIDLMKSDAAEGLRIGPHAPPPREVAPGEGALDDAIGIAAAARRPVVLAGRGAVGARDAILRLADRLEAPVATTLKAKGLFRGAPYDMGVFGTLSGPEAVETILKADCILAFGASLTEYTSAHGAYFDGKRVVQVSDRADTIGSFHHPDAAVIGDPARVAEAMVYWLDEAEIAPSGFTADLEAGGLAGLGPVPKPARDGLDYLWLLHRLNAILPDDRIYVTDAGRHMVKALQILDVPDPLSLVQTASLGSIGLGMGYAVGAAEAAGGRPVVLTTGDGGFMLGGLTEFNTAVRQGTDLIVILMNDGAYGAEHVVLRDRQMDPGVAMFDWPDFAPLADALGGTGVTVRSAADLDALPGVLAARTGPILVDVKLDPDRMPFY
ncbi:thiamine pyrophosphate-binding protein [Rhodobacterales bacterium HKCCE2091]|nr:thiamine pyrophosphate-binding protein [Rhodobacterales bacterium HKCCE2091]